MLYIFGVENTIIKSYEKLFGYSHVVNSWLNIYLRLIHTNKRINKHKFVNETKPSYAEQQIVHGPSWNADQKVYMNTRKSKTSQHLNLCALSTGVIWRCFVVWRMTNGYFSQINFPSSYTLMVHDWKRNHARPFVFHVNSHKLVTHIKLNERERKSVNSIEKKIIWCSS